MRRGLLCTLLMYFAVCMPQAAVAAQAQATWPDGTAIVRFDKRQDVKLEPVAAWKGLPPRHWAGPTIWINRIEDWEVRDGALICSPTHPAACRTAHLLSWDLVDRPKPFYIRVILRMGGQIFDGFAGFLIGAGEGALDWRARSLIQGLPGRGGGLLAVVETSGEGGISFREMGVEVTKAEWPPISGQQVIIKNPIRLDYHRMVLNLEGIPRPGGTYELRFSVWAQHAGDLLAAAVLPSVPAKRLLGGVALVAHSAGKRVTHIFEDFMIGGGRFEHHPDHTFGPIAGTLYSLSGRTLKLAAQFVNLGQATGPRGRRLAARLETRPADQPDAPWRLIDGPKALAPPDYYILFRSDNWDSSRDWQCRVVFTDADGRTYTYPTLVRRDPVDRDVFTLAAFTGQCLLGRRPLWAGPKPGPGQVVVGRWTPANVWFPFDASVRALLKINPDLLVFTGDQIYEGTPTPPTGGRMPMDDYLYKWLFWHWAFQPLTSRCPSIVMTDDHDVYHGNLWGWGGRLCLTNRNWDGGYLCSPYFVNMVLRTQAGHNPDPFDPKPLPTGIINYYCTFTYGGIGFAVLEDRKFKVPPHPPEGTGPVLLGPGQEEMLRRFISDWAGQKFKVILSQTVYASMHVDWRGRITADRDTNGYPKPGRDRAVDLFRRCGALIVCGDQHLGTFARLGIEKPSDAVYQFCVPALANFWWRWFYPAEPGRDRKPGEPDYLGEFVDGFGNFFRMIAVANPERRELLKQKLRQRAIVTEEEARQGYADRLRVCKGDGYGVVRINKKRRQVRIECWPWDADPLRDRQYPGWPILLSFDEMDGRTPAAWLPDVRIVSGPSDAVVLIIDEATGEVVKAARASGGRYRPPVFEPKHTYTLRIGEPGVGWREFRGLKPSAKPGARTIEVRLGS